MHSFKNILWYQWDILVSQKTAKRIDYYSQFSWLVWKKNIKANQDKICESGWMDMSHKI